MDAGTFYTMALAGTVWGFGFFGTLDSLDVEPAPWPLILFCLGLGTALTVYSVWQSRRMHTTPPQA